MAAKPLSSTSLSASESVRRGLPYFGVVALLHGVALPLWTLAALHSPLLWGVGLSAYLFGLRHAWDADHIAVIDNTVRKLLSWQRPAYGVGLYFSLGHSSVVFLMAILAALVGRKLLGHQDQMSTLGSWIGPLVAGIYLITVACVNLYGAAQLLHRGKEPHHHHGGVLARLIAPLTAWVSHGWQAFPLGFLMGLGFDTASEVALLALTGQAGQQHLGWGGILALPLLFAAGMTLLDTLDGVAMSHAYGWALHDPGKKRAYNLLVTGLSGVMALVIGAVTLGQWAGQHVPALAQALAGVQRLDVSLLGFWLAGLTALLFAGAQWYLKLRTGEQTG